MSDVLVSFVVPAYNEEALIGSCLAAITAEVSRTRCRAEIIVVNNGSTDGTSRIASAIPGVKIIDEPQKGLVQARRAGCLAATGELIANIDADTVLAEGWLETALAEFAGSPNLVALSGPFVHYDLPIAPQLIASAFYRCAHIVHLLSGLVTGAGSVMQGGNFIVTKKALEAAGGFNPDFQFYGEDAELARRLGKVGAVKFTECWLGIPRITFGPICSNVHFRPTGWTSGTRLASTALSPRPRLTWNPNRGDGEVLRGSFGI